MNVQNFLIASHRILRNVCAFWLGLWCINLYFVQVTLVYVSKLVSFHKVDNQL